MTANKLVIKVGEEPPPLVSTTKRNAPKTTHIPANPTTQEKAAKTGTRFLVINNFADFTLAGLSRGEIVVWLLLWRDTKADGLARTAQMDLARRAGANTRTVERAVRSLERRGLLTVVRRGGLRLGPSSYRVHSLTRELPTPQPP